MIKLDRLPSPYSKKMLHSTSEKSYPAVIAHFNKGELVDLDRQNGGRKMDRRLGIPSYMGLNPLFTHMMKNPHMLEQFNSKIAKGYAKGGHISAKQMQKIKASFGTNGDTERAIIPKSMARVLNHIVGYSKNPHTGDPQYAMGSDFISSLGSYMPSMDTIASGIGSAASGMLNGGTNPSSSSGTSSTSAAPSSSSPASTGDSSKSSIMGSLVSTLAPAAINAIGKRFSGPSSPSSAPTSNASVPQSAPSPVAPDTSANTNPAVNPALVSPNPSMMDLFRKQMNNNPYGQFANQMYDRYQKNGAQGVRDAIPTMTSDAFHRMMQSYFNGNNFGGYGGGNSQSMPFIQPYMDNNNAAGNDMGNFSPTPYTPSGVRGSQSSPITRSTSRRSTYR